MSIKIKSNNILAICLVGCVLTSVHADEADYIPNEDGLPEVFGIDMSSTSPCKVDQCVIIYGHRQPGLFPGDAGQLQPTLVTSPPAAPNPKGAPPSQKNNKQTPCGVNNTNPATSHPVIIATGEKIKTETDFAGAGLYPLGLTRYYHGFGENVARMFGSNWTSNYDYHLYAIGCDHENAGPFPKSTCIPHSFELDTPDGNFVYTKPPALNAVTYTVANSAEMGTITFNGPYTPYGINIGVGTHYDFDSTGKILDIFDASGASQTFQYSGNNLISVTSPGNQRIQFTWNGNSVSQVTDPRGQIWTYNYNAAGMLQSVSSPDGHSTLYGYDPTYTSRLTSITVDGTTVLAVTYNTNGQVASSGTPDGEKVESFAYGSLSTTVTNQLGDSTTFGYQSIQGGLKLASVSHLGTATCSAMAATTVYDANGWVDYTIDWRGTKTDYTYTADGRLSDMTLGSGTATPMEHAYTWTTLTEGIYRGAYLLQSDAAYDTNGKLVSTTAYTYTGNAFPASISITDQTTGSVATVSYGYTYASNQTLQSRTETRNLPTGAATTTYNYDSSGNLTSLTDPSGATVSYSGYDGLGRPSSMTAPNGVTHNVRIQGGA